MKFKINCAFLMIILLPALIYCQPSGFVKIEGKNFVDADGNVLQLKGINLGNWLNPEGYMFHFAKVNSYWMIDDVIKELIGPYEAQKFWQRFRDNYITKEDIAFIKKLGFNHIRVPFNFRLFVSEDHPGNYYQEGFKRLDDVIKWCQEEKIYVVLDMHAAPGGQTGDNIDDSYGYPFLFDSEEAQQTAIALWAKIAERYKDEPTVIGYDLLNEPIAHFLSDAKDLEKKLEPFYQKVTAAIRESDKKHLIFLGGAEWDTNMKMFGPPFDSKLSYTFHKYWMSPVQDQIQEYVDFSNKYNVPIWCGETGENKDDWVNDFRELLEKNNIGWCFWPYKKMDSPRGVVSFKRTPEWDQIIKFAEGPRNSFEEIRKAKPSKEVIQKALDDLIENIKFKNCSINDGFIKALSLKSE